MSIIRTVKNRDYFVAPNEPFAGSGLSWGARGMLAYLLSRPDGWEVRTKNLINETPAGRDANQTIINELKNSGYMRRFKDQDETGKIVTITEVYERLELNPEYRKSRPTEIPSDGNPVDIVSTENKESTEEEAAPPESPDFDVLIREIVSAWADEFGSDMTLGGFEFKKKRVSGEKNETLRKNLRHWLKQKPSEIGDDETFVANWREALAMASRNYHLRASGWFTLLWFTGVGKSGREAGWYRVWNDEFGFRHDEFLKNNKKTTERTAVVKSNDGGFYL